MQTECPTSVALERARRRCRPGAPNTLRLRPTNRLYIAHRRRQPRPLSRRRPPPCRLSSRINNTPSHVRSPRRPTTGDKGAANSRNYIANKSRRRCRRNRLLARTWRRRPLRSLRPDGLLEQLLYIISQRRRHERRPLLPARHDLPHSSW